MMYEEVLREFQKRKVRYVLVGGLAVLLYGLERVTADLDILVDMTDKNLEKIVRVLKKQGYFVKQPVDPMNIAKRKIREDWIKNKHMKAFNFYKKGEHKEVDIIIASPISYRKARKKAVCFKAGELKLWVISVRDLIVMKQKAKRPIDKFDIKELRRMWGPRRGK